MHAHMHTHMPCCRRAIPWSRRTATPRLQPATRRLQASDVMVTSHGADMINAFALHRGASVLEVMPVYQVGHIKYTHSA